MFRSIYYILTVFAVMTLASATAHAGGVAGVCGLGHNKSYSSPPTNNAYLCTQGIASSTAYSSGRWVWTCTGSDGSAPTRCSADNCGPAPVAGVCDNSTRNACSAGTANDAAVADTSTQYRWRCDGQNYGANSGICSMTIPPTPVAGVCNNSTRNACSAGTANDGAIADTTNEYKWRCDGENGGANSGTCSLTKPAGPSCRDSVTYVGCANCEINDFTCPSGQVLRHRSSGQFLNRARLYWPDTLSDYECVAEHLCTGAPPPVTGSCGPARHWTTASQTVLEDAGLCDAGSASAITSPSSSTWAWTCGGAACNAGRCSNGTLGPYGAEHRLIDWDGWVGDGCYNEMEMRQTLKSMNGGVNPPSCGTAAANNSTNRVCITTRLGKADCNDAFFIGFDGMMRGMTGGNCPPPPQNGLCGSSSRGTYTNTEPTSDFCFFGSRTNYRFDASSGAGGAWKWNCTGEPGASDASCGRPKTPPGSCPYNGNVYLNGQTWTNTIPCPPGEYGSRTYRYRCNSGSIANEGVVSGMCERGGPAGPN